MSHVLVRARAVAAVAASALLMLIAPSLPAGAVAPETFTVNTTADDAPNVAHCTDNDNSTLCSLREAVLAANAHANVDGPDDGSDPDPDVILLPELATYALTIGGGFLDPLATAQGDLDVTEAVIVQGSARDDTIIEAAFAFPAAHRIFDVTGGGLTLRSVTLSSGRASFSDDPINPNGGAIRGVGVAGDELALTLDDAVIEDSVTERDGGGIACTDCVLTIQDGSILRANTTPNDTTDVRIGGGVWCDTCIVDVDDSTFLLNIASPSGLGGGIACIACTLTVDGSTFRLNKAGPAERGALQLSNVDGAGGGIYADVDTVANVRNSSRFIENEAVFGAGVYVGVPPTVGFTPAPAPAVALGACPATTAGLCFAGSSAVDGLAVFGGGLASAASAVRVEGSELSDNFADIGGGGIAVDPESDGIYGGPSGSDAVVMESELTDNRGNGEGGGIFAGPDSTSSLFGSLVSGNLATRSGQYEGPLVLGRGGGVFADSDLTIEDTEIDDNEANDDGGGVFLDGTGVTTIRNTTISNNVAVDGGGLYAGDATADGIGITNATFALNAAERGAGLYVLNDAFSARHLTVADNVASAAGAGLWTETGGAGTVEFGHSLFDDNTDSSPSQPQNCSGDDESSAGYNYTDDATCTGFTGFGPTPDVSIPGGEFVGALGEHGGSTPTVNLLVSGPVDGGQAAPCQDAGGANLDEDQRGVSRPQDGDATGAALCDPGAYEFERMVVTVAATDASAAEPNDDGTFTITRTGDLAAAQNVNYALAGTATNGDDYTALTGTAGFAAGASEVEIVVDVLDDPAEEPAETVTLTLLPDFSSFDLGSPDSATVTIAANDQVPVVPAVPVVSVTAVDAEAAEDPNDEGEFRISRTGSTADELVVEFGLTGDAIERADFSEIGREAIIPAGASSVDVPVTVVDDAEVEGDEHVVLSLTDQGTYDLGADDTATVTIVSDDVPAPAGVPVVTLVASRPLGSELGSVAGQLTFTRDSGFESELVVVYSVSGSASPGSDFGGLTGAVTFPAGSGSATVAVSVFDDEEAEELESVVVTLSDGGAAYTVGSPGSATVTIGDDDSGVAVSALSDGDEAGGDGRFRIGRGDAPAGQDLEVWFRVTGSASFSGDYEPLPGDFSRSGDALNGRITIPAGAVSVDLPVEVVDDDAVEGAETVTVTLTPRDNYDVAAPGTATVTILDDEDPSIVREEGVTRVETAVEVSQRTYPDGNDRVVIARHDVYADALAGGPFASLIDAPILLTNPEGLHPSTAAEVERLGAEAAYLLGGEAALSEQVADDLRGLGVATIVRIGGATRFDTAAEIAARVVGRDASAAAAAGFRPASHAPGSRHAYVVEGADDDPSRGWPDAVAVSALASFQQLPILLATTESLTPSTAAALTDLDITDVTVVGGPVAISADVISEINALGIGVGRTAGADRFATSVAVATVAETVGMSPRSVWLASGSDWPDALVAGPAVAADGGILLLVDEAALANSAATAAWLAGHKELIATITLLGGPAAVSTAVQAEIAATVDR